MGFNYLKEWKATIGGMAIVQKAQPNDDGETLLVITGMRGPRPFDYHNASSTIPFADVERLADDAFRMEIARRDLAERVLRLRAVVDFAAAALAAAATGPVKAKCGIVIPLSQNSCTRPAGHSGACRCSAGDVDDREAHRGEYAAAQARP